MNNKIYKLKDNILEGGKYECQPDKNFPDICIESSKGIYHSKESCINDCETKYINQQLKSLPLTKENIHVGIPQLQKVFQPFTQLSKPNDSENGVTAMFGINHSLPFAIMKYGVKRSIL